MIEVKRQLVPADGTSFSEVSSFLTDNYVGLFEYTSSRFILMPQCGYEFSMEDVGDPDTLQELDDAVFEAVGEHITAVSTDAVFSIDLEESKEA